MPLIVRIDVDRPYGRQPLGRHLLSRAASDVCLPRINAFGYLRELKDMLQALNKRRARAYVFFRRCTLPSADTMDLIEQGRHEIGLHLENSRSYETFATEKTILEEHVNQRVRAISKHGSGGARYGFHHHAPYEPDKYIQWAYRAGMKLFLGNLQDPTLCPQETAAARLRVYPSAFWLEPPWRDTQRFTVDWLRTEAQRRDVVLLVHPENVAASSALTSDFTNLIEQVETRIVE